MCDTYNRDAHTALNNVFFLLQKTGLIYTNHKHKNVGLVREPRLLKTERLTFHFHFGVQGTDPGGWYWF